jgi:hypothetical protein
VISTCAIGVSEAASPRRPHGTQGDRGFREAHRFCPYIAVSDHHHLSTFRRSRFPETTLWRVRPRHVAGTLYRMSAQLFSQAAMQVPARALNRPWPKRDCWRGCEPARLAFVRWASEPTAGAIAAQAASPTPVSPNTTISSPAASKSSTIRRIHL